MESFKYWLKNYFVYIFIGFAISFSSILFYDLYFSSKTFNNVYVIDIKKVVDLIQRDYLINSSKNLNKAEFYEEQMKKRFYLLDKYLKSKKVVILEKSALVYYPKGKVVDFTEEALSILGISNNKVKRGER